LPSRSRTRLKGQSMNERDFSNLINDVEHHDDAITEDANRSRN
jgi:hypothetical protein